MTQLYIPSKIKIGFQKRHDTFTGKLAYVVYYDDKGTLRQETSWNSWRDDKIEPIEFENTPRSGFIFNKGVQRSGYWGSGRSVVRVYDARDFEFEISVDNLIGILMHSDVSKRDIVEDCVFAWSGKNLVLLPINSEEYQQSVAYTKKQAESFSAKTLVKGYTYNQKKSDEILTYMGYFEWFDWDSNHSDNVTSEIHKTKGKKHIFYNGYSFKPVGMATLSSVCNEAVVDNYADLVDKFFATTNSQKIIGYEVKLGINSESHYLYLNLGNKKLIKTYISTYNLTYYFRNMEQIAQFAENTQIVELDFSSSLTIHTHKNIPRRYAYYNQKYNDEHLSSEQKALTQKLLEMVKERNINLPDITETQVKEMLNQSGFGKLVAVLENKKTVEYK